MESISDNITTHIFVLNQSRCKVFSFKPFKIILGVIMIDSTILIETNSGPVRGIKRTTILGNDYLSFQSIPYAKPPIGPLRFRVNKNYISLVYLKSQIHFQGSDSN